ncbi:MAG TPA: glycogen debranching N-terminal domain-containing protein [Ktedonobacteraceae bacterium]|nr:glycogen debranching N-terminal domain-containing protein [Ktedonobacteraceae bacterium]
MPIEIRVGPPTITISQGRTFMVTTQKGGIQASTNQGVYALDTRFISFYRLYINRTPLSVINSSQLSFYAARFHLTNPSIETEGGSIAAQTLRVTLNRLVSEGIHEDIEVANYSGKKVAFLLEIAIRSDFADLFEVKSKHIIQRGKQNTHWDVQGRSLRTSYDHKDFHRAFTYHITSDARPGYANGRLFFEIELEPNQHWYSCGDMILEHGQQIKCPTPNSCHQQQRATKAEGATPTSGQQPRSDFDERQARWQARCTAMTASNHTIARMYQQAIEDMGALRIYDMDVSDEAWIPAAGVPWFVTLFGRDSLTVSYQNMAVSAGFAGGALRRLSEYQATERDDWREAQPGKIMEEKEKAQALKQQAADLKRAFNERFWMEKEGCFAFGLDPDKKLITSIASNAGQCLWSGIADPDKAERTAKRLLQTDMWSGWGIRTLSSHNGAYDPFAYQRGSVWPQDNGIIAAGFKRYGLVNEANQVIRAIFDATERFDAYRPPEVFAGVERDGDLDFPILYPAGANIPQAWATGSIFHMIRTILGLCADAPHQRRYVYPTLPEWLPDIELHHLRVGPCSLSIRFWREGANSRWEVQETQADKGTAQQDYIQVKEE